MDLGLSGKRILIAGGSRGIGLAMARGFLDEGARVLLLARNPRNLSAAISGLTDGGSASRVIGIPADCSDMAAWPPVIEKLMDVWGGLDVAIANVGDGRGTQEAMPDPSRLAAAWRTNFTSAEATARSCLPLLEESRGSMLFVSSIAGLEAIGAPVAYSIAKTALFALTKQLARRLAPNVRVNCLVPGNVHFPGGSWDDKLKEDSRRVAELIESTVPMRRFGAPDEIASAALFLCSSRAGFITGARLVVDGGQTVSVL